MRLQSCTQRDTTSISDVTVNPRRLQQANCWSHWGGATACSAHPGDASTCARRGCAAPCRAYLPSPFSEPPGLVKLQASIPAPPEIEGLLTPRPPCETSLSRRQTPARLDFCPPETCRRSPREGCFCLLSRPFGFRRGANACAQEISYPGLCEGRKNSGPPSMVSNTKSRTNATRCSKVLSRSETIPWATWARIPEEATAVSLCGGQQKWHSYRALLDARSGHVMSHKALTFKGSFRSGSSVHAQNPALSAAHRRWVARVKMMLTAYRYKDLLGHK